VSGGALLVAAYGLIWTLAVLYIVWLTRRHTQNSQRIQDLARRLERLEAGGRS
jgi:prolipoprotein diacylglyceryltransferase